MPKYYLLAGDTSQISILFPYIRYKLANSIDLFSKLFLTYRVKVNH